MGKFRKKPGEIDAFRWDGWSCTQAEMLMGIPLAKGHFDEHSGMGAMDLLIQTPVGTMRAKPGDWVIKGVQGEWYPCKPDIFDATYEPVESDPIRDTEANIKAAIDYIAERYGSPGQMTPTTSE